MNIRTHTHSEHMHQHTTYILPHAVHGSTVIVCGIDTRARHFIHIYFWAGGRRAALCVICASSFAGRRRRANVCMAECVCVYVRSR